MYVSKLILNIERTPFDKNSMAGRFFEIYVNVENCRLRRLAEPVQLLYVLMFTICLIHRDKIYIDKVPTVF